VSGWPEVELGEICEFKYGKSLPAEARDGGPFPVYGSNGVVGSHSAAITGAPVVIIGRKGSFGEIEYSTSPCWPIDTTYFVDSAATKTDLKWLSYRLRGLGLTTLNRAAAIPGLNREDAYRQRLLLPPLDEQRRIAAILDQAGALRAKRRQVLAHLDALAQSIFHDMFGRVEASSTVEDVAVNIRTGPFGSQLLHGEFVDEGVAVLGLDNVVQNEFSWVGKRFITHEKYEKLRRYTVSPGDVLISIMGTTGRCVIVPEDIGPAINTKHMCAITVDRERVDPEFLRASFLWHPESRAHLLRQTKGSIMDGLNMGIIKSMPVPLPTLSWQREFARRIAQVGVQRTCVRRVSDAEDALFRSLQSRAFRGEL
jgi:type I restriction enzyme, S subunit